MIKKQTAVDGYIQSFPEEVRVILKKIRTLIKKTAPKTEEIISYGIPTLDMNGKHLVHFAGFKNHIGFFPTPSAIVAFKDELKGTVQFLLGEPIPYGLVEKIVKFRINEIK